MNDSKLQKGINSSVEKDKANCQPAYAVGVYLLKQLIERVMKMADEKIIGIHTNQEHLQKAVDCFTACKVPFNRANDGYCVHTSLLCDRIFLE